MENPSELEKLDYKGFEPVHQISLSVLSGSGIKLLLRIWNLQLSSAMYTTTDDIMIEEQKTPTTQLSTSFGLGC